jgi:hypothetical protein
MLHRAKPTPGLLVDVASVHVHVAWPCPLLYFAAIEIPETNIDLFTILREHKICVIFTPCCAFATSMPR